MNPSAQVATSALADGLASGNPQTHAAVGQLAFGYAAPATT
jgi:hypothetical protein